MSVLVALLASSWHEDLNISDVIAFKLRFVSVLRDVLANEFAF
jgi:hypothetical protein